MIKLLVIAFFVMALPAAAQTGLLVASPIPDGAESRFCYYQGLAYSRDAYIQVGGGNTVVYATGSGQTASGSSGGVMNAGGQISTQEEQKLLRCVAGDDGVLGWSPVATLQIGK